MAFYIRKSVSVGPIRFNLSKSGIGTSVGVTGFRVGVRPNGSSYVHAGRHGLYYREELGGRRNSNNRIIDSEVYENNDIPTEKYNSVSAKELRPTSRKELLDKLNKSYSSIRLDYLSAIIVAITSFYLFSINNLYGILAASIGIIATIYIAYWESKRRTIEINYDFKSNSSEKFEKRIHAFNFLTGNNKTWAMIDSRNIYSHESKINAGADNLVNRSVSKIGEGKPPWVKTNINIPVIVARGQSIYFMPDGLLVYDNKNVGFVEYSDLILEDGKTNFIEDDRVPKDAEISYYSWKYSNRNGGPDKRFKNNHQIPVCNYGTIIIKSTNGLFLYLMTSQADSPFNFCQNFKTY
ncbi:DUF4236 domain-containing protein [Lutimonas halocynthiae]|uniref:DUF4236 domain-containing protein n=1 Tax=Lutimonas halocynthiae TaxID=1446477 RepID=UPI0025B4A201|nr:DUF4236 domain-containing protein [Lutimonas halocynthiae]MDN3643747.1 DUF4236 domain-containing protein [Lutimonas halocynthiae]